MVIRKKKQKKLNLKNGEQHKYGDFWGFTSIKRESCFFISFKLGKRTNRTCEEHFEDFRNKIEPVTEDKKLEIFSDGNFQYETTIPKYFDIDHVNYGQIVKIKEGGKVIRKEKRIIFGELDPKEIDTVYVECLNTCLRARLGRLVRKTQCHAKKKEALQSTVQLFQFYWNFMKIIKKKLSPAMIEGLSTKIWTWGNFLHYIIKY